ncbi:hypothetical protein Trydic_g10163 [Trypoxylus dichotomus]
MSMLAERKQKQRWSLNPRGRLWTEDKNTFGHKMLEKMGWKHGKGLGANENGRTESLQVVYKNDSKGIGYKEVEGWTAHEDNFSSLLKNLNQNAGDETDNTQITSLEKKTQKSRARINYHKFTKAKDLSRYSEKDLANIFGKKSLKQKKNEVKKEEEKQIENNDLLVNKGSMIDYFKKKLPNFGRNVENDKNDESDYETNRVGFGFTQNHTENHQNGDNEPQKRKRSYTDALSSIESSSDEPRKKKKLKTNKANGTFTSYIYSDDRNVSEVNEIGEYSSLQNLTFHKKESKQKNKDDTNEAEDNENTAEEEGRKKKRKSKIDDIKNDEKFVDSPAKTKKKKQENSNYSEDQTEIEHQVACDELTDKDEEQMKINKKQKKSKKRKHEKEIELGISNAAFCDFNSSELVEMENQDLIEENCDQSKRRKKKSKKEKTYEEASLDMVQNGIEVSEMEETNEIKTKKTKKDKRNEVGNETKKEPSQLCESQQAMTKQKKSKKRRTTESEECGISNPAFNDNIDNSVSLDEIESKEEIIDETPRKKKKKNRKSKDIIENGIDNPTFNPVLNSPDLTEELESISRTNSAKHEKTSKEEVSGIDNPALNLNDILNTDLMLNVISAPVILKKPSIDKVVLNSKIERIKNGRRKSVRFSDVLEEHIIPNDPSERVNEYISQRNELFDINTMVIEESIKEEMEKKGMKYEKRPQIRESDPEELNQLVVESSVKEELNRGLSQQGGFVNNGFDIRSVDKIDFYHGNYEVQSSPNTNGIDNRGFNKLKTEIEENIEDITNTIDRYQAEVENDINEAKDTQDSHNLTEEWLVGDVGTQIMQNMRVERFTKLCFKDMHFRTPIPNYSKGKNISRPKKSYRHLIRGDITVAFCGSNLHEIKGYAAQNRGRHVTR